MGVLGWSVKLVFCGEEVVQGRVLRLHGLFWDVVLIRIYSDQFESRENENKMTRHEVSRIRTFLAPSYTHSPADQGKSHEVPA